MSKVLLRGVSTACSPSGGMERGDPVVAGRVQGRQRPFGSWAFTLHKL